MDFGKLTKNTQVLISFGAILGGFEFALQIRRDIMNKFGNHSPEFVYIDAVSLENSPYTKYTWDPKLGIFKMSNDKWKEYYQNSLNNCKTMIFLISKPWLESNWCWDEFEWYEKIITEKAITPIFVVFKDAQEILTYGNKIIDKTGKSHDLKSIWQQILTKNRTTIEINSPIINEMKSIVIENESYTYSYMYSCSESEQASILSKVKI